MKVGELHAELQGVLGSVKDNFRDVRADSIFTDEEVLQEADVMATLTHLLDIWQEVMPYLNEDGPPNA